MMTVAEVQADIVKRFTFFSQWEERYQYLIQMGRKLEKIDESEMLDDNLIPGCQSQVWLVVSQEGDQFHFKADADSVIVRGLIALLLKVYEGRTADEILNAPLDFLAEIGLNEHLSPTRSNGLASMIKTIHQKVSG